MIAAKVPSTWSTWKRLLDFGHRSDVQGDALEGSRFRVRPSVRERNSRQINVIDFERREPGEQRIVADLADTSQELQASRSTAWFLRRRFSHYLFNFRALHCPRAAPGTRRTAQYLLTDPCPGSHITDAEPIEPLHGDSSRFTFTGNPTGSSTGYMQNKRRSNSGCGSILHAHRLF